VSGDLVLVTVTHAQDLDRFRLLRRSLREVGAAARFRHLVALDTECADAVPDLRREPNVDIVLTRDLLTRRFERRRAAAHYGRTRRRHYVRGGALPGWYTQQLVKLATLAHADGAQAIAFFDSDLVAIRPLELADFIAPSGATRFFVDSDMRGDGSDAWNRAAARLLRIDESLVATRQFIHTPTVVDVRIGTALLRALSSDRGAADAWQERMAAANVFESPASGAWVMGTSLAEVEVSEPLPTANFVQYEDMWDFRERAARVIAEGRVKILGVQSRLHIPPSSYESIVAAAWK
jgi:hypothetical protein